MVKKKGTKKAKVPKKAKKEVKEPKEEKIGKEIGKVTHYFSHIGVAVIKLEKNIKLGDTIRIKGATTDFTQKIDSMQVDHKDIEEAKPKDDIGMKVAEPVREHDIVYKV